MIKFAGRALVAALAFAATAAFAQSYPAKPVRIIIGYGAGGVTDVILRLVADDLGKHLGQAFIVENRPGAGGLIAARFVKSSAPDGYTLYGGSATPFTAVFMKDNMDAAKDLQPVSIMALGDWFVFVRAEVGASNLKELAAKGKTMKLKFASPSPANHGLMASVAKQLGFEYENIPYKTTDQTITSVVAGDTDFTLNNPAGFTSYVQQGKIRAVATFAPQRTPLMPNVPTAKEQGVDMETRFNMGMWAPLGTSKDVVAKLGAGIAEAMKNPAVVEKISGISMIPTGSTPEELVHTFQAEVKTYAAAAAVVGLQPQ
jgi:tripartite-type tricarboxylate transporter receptor subunit TctC